MKKPGFPSGLSVIAQHYDVILCDVWGVVHNGRHAFQAACDALIRFRNQGGVVCLVTNAPVPGTRVIAHFQPLGVPAESYDTCVSSGDTTRAILHERRHEVFWRLGVDEGRQNDQFLYEGLGLKFAGPDEAETILCIGPEDPRNVQLETYRPHFANTIKRGGEMICANPDIQVRVGDHLFWCAGVLARLFEEEGGHVMYSGKPHRAIYELALSRLSATGVRPDGGRVLCIGDSFATDMRGAACQGHDSLYVGTGLEQHGKDFPRDIEHLKARFDTDLAWAMPQLVW